MNRNEVRQCINQYLQANNVTVLTSTVAKGIEASLKAKYPNVQYGNIYKIEFDFRDFFQVSIKGSIKRCDPIEGSHIIDYVNFEINSEIEVMAYDGNCSPLTLDMENLSKDDIIDLKHFSGFDVYKTFMRVKPTDRGKLAEKIEDCLRRFNYDIPPYAFYRYKGKFLHPTHAIGDIGGGRGFGGFVLEPGNIADIGAQIVSIGEHAFDGCTNLREVFIKSHIHYVGKHAFSNIPGLIIHCPFSSKPNQWDDEWCDENCRVIWDRLESKSYIGKKIKNNAPGTKNLGIGEIVEVLDDKYFIVDFPEKKGMKLLYPDSFTDGRNEFLDAELQTEANRDKAIADDEKAREIERQQREMERTRNQNVAIKCNYCDGGCSDEVLGFKDICSPELMKRNVNKYAWCSQDKCRCKQYVSGLIDENSLRSGENVCSESNLLNSWRAYVGEDRDGNHRTIKNAGYGNLVVLTTVTDEEKEENRAIFAAFLIDEIREGDEQNTGYVGGQRYHITLTPEECRKILFWNYYANGDGSKFWGAGLVRYFDDDIAKKILEDIVSIKIGKYDEQKARDLLDEFMRRVACLL